MGIRYSNITLQGVSQNELVNYLSNIKFDAYVSPTVDEYTVLYDLASIGYPHKLPKYIQQEYNFSSLCKRYLSPQQAIMACLCSHLSRKFNCSTLAIYVLDGITFWYHLSQNGYLLDEYITDNYSHSKIKVSLTDKIATHSAEKLCSAFGKQNAIAQVKTILGEPVETYNSMTRHELLAKALEIRPCWVVGMNYHCFTEEDDFEAHYECDREDCEPSYEEALQMVKKTIL